MSPLANMETSPGSLAHTQPPLLVKWQKEFWEAFSMLAALSEMGVELEQEEISRPHLPLTR